MGTFTAPALLQRLTLLQRHGHFYSASIFTPLDTLNSVIGNFYSAG